MIQSKVTDIEKFKAGHSQLIKKVFGFRNNSSCNKLQALLEVIKDDLIVFIEYPYVDRLYRDSYYNFYSSAHLNYKRDCMRVSLFENHNDIDFTAVTEQWQEAFLGFFIIRPIENKLLGRSFFSPLALKTQNFLCCLSRETINIRGIEFSTHGFSHSTQDAKMASCAETSVWSLVDYFSKKYHNYPPVTPGQIHSILEKTFYQRFLPSNGLTAIQISSTLQQLGFSPRIYSIISERKNEEQIYTIISDYIESGIPVIIAIKGSFGGHAMLLIGHEENADYNNLTSQTKENLVDAAVFRKRYISVDDNKSPYRLIELQKPMADYKGDSYNNASISSVIVPLYPRIYIEAPEAKRFFEIIVNDEEFGFKFDTEKKVIIRRMLTSSRSLKRWVVSATGLNESIQKVLLQLEMPKFIWLAEYSYSDYYEKKQINALLIIDATGASNAISSLLFRYFNGVAKMFDKQSDVFRQVNSSVDNWPMYQNNLKGAWNQWKSN